MKAYDVICDCGFRDTILADNRNKAYDGECPQCFGEMRWAFGIQVISDQLGNGVQGVLNHADGKMYDSKSAYHRTLNERGFHVREDKEPPSGVKEYKPVGIKQDIAQALKQHT